MIRHRTEEEVRRFDQFKIGVAIILLLLLLLVATQQCSSDLAPEASQPGDRTADTPAGQAGITIADPSITSPFSNETLDDGELILTGQGTPNSEVRLMLNGDVLGNAPVDNDGNWTFATTLSEGGSYQIQAQSLSSIGSVIAESAPISVSWAGPPEVVETPEDTTAAPDETEAGLLAPSVDSPPTSLEGEVLSLTGTGMAGTQVQAVVNDEPAAVTEVDSEGRWALDLSLPERGDYNVQIQGLDADGNAFGTAEAFVVSRVGSDVQPIVVQIPVPQWDVTSIMAETANDAIKVQGQGKPGTTVRVLVDDKAAGTTTVDENGDWSFEAIVPELGDHEIGLELLDQFEQVIASKARIPITRIAPDVQINSPDPANALELFNDSLALAGTSTPNTRFNIVADGESIASVESDAEGNWATELDIPRPGLRSYQAQVQYADGEVAAASDELAVYRIIAPTLSAFSNPFIDSIVSLGGKGTPGLSVQVKAGDQPVAQVPVDRNGNWSYSTFLPEPGEYTFQAGTVNRANEVVAESGIVSVNRASPAPPPTIELVNTDANGVVSDPDLMVTGSGTPHTQIQVLVDDEPVGTTVVGANGQWEFSLPLAEAGNYNVQARALSQNGIFSRESRELVATRVVPPEAPTIAVAETETFGNTVAVSGTGEPNTNVRLRVDNRVVGLAPVDEAGNWHFTAILPELGDYEITAEVVGDNNRALAVSEAATVSRLSNVEAPTLALTNVDEAGEFTADVLAATGTGTPNSVVRVLVDGEPVGTTAVNPAGTWSFDIPVDNLGKYQISAEALDQGERAIGLSNTELAAKVPAMVAPTINAVPNPFISNGLLLSGTGTPGSTLEIVALDRAVGTTPVDRQGNWSFSLLLPEPGYYYFKADAVDNDEIVASSRELEYTLPAPVAPPTLMASATEITADSLTVSGTGTPGSRVRVLIDGTRVGIADVGPNGTWSLDTAIADIGLHEIQAEALDAGGFVAGLSDTVTVNRSRLIEAPSLAVSGVDVDNETEAAQVSVSGTGTPESTLRLKANDEPVGTTRVDSNGNWDLSVPLPAVGSYGLTAEALDRAGNAVASSDTVAVSRVPATVAPTLAVTNVDRDDETSDAVAALTGTGTPNRQIQVLLDGEAVGTTTANNLGSWVFEAELPELGTYDVQAQALNKQNEVVAETDIQTISRVEPIAAPTLAALSSRFADDILILSGTGTPNSTLRILAQGEPVGNTPVDRNGNWSFTLGLPTPGEYTVQAEALDKNDRAVAASNPLVYTRIRPVTAPTLIASATELTADPLTVSGTGTPDSRVQVIIDGEVVGETQVDSNGRWRFDTNLTELGPHQITARAIGFDDTIAGASNIVTVNRLLPIVAPTLAVATTELEADTLAVSGTGTPNTDIRVRLDGEVAEVTRVNSDGTWATELTVSEPGEHTIVAEALDRSGDFFADSETALITRLVPIMAPTLVATNVDDDGEFTTDTLAVSGSGTPNSAVQLLVDGSAAGISQVDENGSWSSTIPINNLGKYQLTAAGLNRSNEAVALSEPVLVSRVRPIVAPTIRAMPNPFMADSLLVSGTGTPESQVQVVAQGQAVGQTLVDKNGNWSFNLQLPEPGDYTLQAGALDKNEQVVATSDTLIYNRPLPIVAPTLVAAADEITTDSVTVSGTGTPGSRLQILVDGVAVGTTQVNDAGNWTFDAPVDGLGEHQISARIVDERGFAIALSNVDAVNRVRPIVAPTIAANNIAADGKLESETLAVSGTATPDSTVRVLVDGQAVGTTRVDSLGNWNLAVSLAEVGTYDITAEALDRAGNPAGTSNALAVSRVLPLVAPTIAVTNADADNEVLDGVAALAGSATPNSRVQLQVNNSIDGVAEVDEAGNWQFETTLPEAGQYQITAQAIDDDNQVAASSSPVSVTYPTPIEAPTLSAFNNRFTEDILILSGTGTPNSQVQVVVQDEPVGVAAVDNNGTWSFVLGVPQPGEYHIQANALNKNDEIVGSSAPWLHTKARTIAPPTLRASATELTDDALTLSGTGTPNSQVQVLVDGALVGTTEVDDDGNWSLDTTLAGVGTYQVTANSLTDDGALAGVSNTLEIERMLPIVAPTIAVDNTELDEDALSVTGTGTPGSDVQLSLAGNVAGIAQVDRAGNWRFPLLITEPGQYDIEAAALDRNGNVVAAADPVTVTRNRPIVAPTLAATNLDRDGEISADTVALIGTGTPESQVQLLLDGADTGAAGRVEVDADGNWTLDLPLTEPGDYQITALALDKNQQAVATSNTVSVTRPAPLATPTLSGISSPFFADVLVLSGKATPNSALQIRSQDTVVGTTSVDNNGNWSFNLRVPEAGQYQIEADALDKNGQVAATSNTLLYTRAAPIAAPTLVASATQLEDETVGLSGTGTPGSQVQVLVDGAVIGTTEVNAEGNWTLDATLPEPGDYQISARSLNTTGTVAGVSNAVAVTRFMRLDAPVLTLAATETTNNVLPVTGTGTAGSTVQITVDGEPVGVTRVNSDGDWRFRLVLDEPGDYALDADALNRNGDVVASADGITVSRLVPIGPATFELVDLDADNETTADTVTVTGTGTAGAEVQVLVDEVVSETITVADDGSWTTAVALPEVGDYQVSVQALDRDGQIVATAGPEQATRILPIVAPTLAVAGLDEDNETTADSVAVSGTATPGSKVQIMVDDAPTGIIDVDANGNWNTTVNLADFSRYAITADGLDKNGNAVANSETVTLARIRAITAPLITDTSANTVNETTANTLDLSGTATPGSTVQIRVDDEVVTTADVDTTGNWSSTIDLPTVADYEIAVDGLDKNDQVVETSDSLTVARILPIMAPTIAATNLDADNETTDAVVNLTGSATPTSQVQILVDGEAVGTTTTDEDGNWSFAADLADIDSYQVRALALDRNGDPAELSDTLTVTRIQAVGAPTLSATNLDADNETTDAVANLSGRGTAGSTIEVLLDGEVVGTTTVAATGRWSLNADLAEIGQYPFTAQALDKNGDVAGSSDTLTVGRIRPIVAPTLTVTNLDDDDETTEAVANLTGTATPNSQVQILVDGEAVGTTTADDEGNWSFAADLANIATYQIVAQGLDKNDEVVASSDQVAATRIRAIGTPTLAGLSNPFFANLLILNGTGTPNSNIQIRVAGEIVGQTTVDNNGNWSFNVQLPEPGTYEIEADALDKTDQVAATSNTLLYTRPVPVAAPTLVADATELEAAQVGLSGVGTPGSRIQVLVDGTMIGTTQVDDEGNWSLDAPLPDVGDYQINARSLETNGSVAGVSNAVVVTRLAPIEPATFELVGLDADNETTADRVTLVGTGSAGSQVQILVDGEVVETQQVDADGSWTADINLADIDSYQISVQTLGRDDQVIAVADPQPATRILPIVAPTLTVTNLDDDDETTDAVANLTGTATPNSQVQILVDGEAVGSTTADEDGNWSFAADLADIDTYQIVAQGLDKNDDVVDSSAPITATRIRTVGAPTLSATNLDADNETTEAVANLTGTGTPDAELQVLLNDDVVGTTLVDEDGTWSLDVALDEIDQYSFTAQALDKNGDVAGSSDTLTVGRIRPIVAPTLTVTNLDDDDETTEAVANLTGTATPNSQVQILVDGEAVGSTTADDEGNWSFEADLADIDTYQIVAQGLDKNDDVVDSSAQVTATRILLVEAPTLAVSNVDTDNETTDAIANLSGTGTPNSTLQIVVNRQIVGTTTVAENGTWSLDIDLETVGRYRVSAQALDKTEAVVGESNPISISRVEPITAPTLAASNVDADDETYDAFATLTGSGTPGSQVQVLVEGEAVGETTVAADGTWNFEAALAEAGDYNIEANALEKNGEVAGTAESITVTRLEAIVDPTLTATNVDADSETTDETLALAGTGTPNSQIQIVVDGEVVGTADVNGEGDWTFETDMPEFSSYDIAANALNKYADVTGNAATLTATRIRPIVAPTLNIPNRDVVVDFVPIGGTATPLSTVQITVEDQVVGTAIADADGNWTLFAILSGPGVYEFRADGVNKQGDVVASSETIAVTRSRSIGAPTLALTDPTAEIGDAPVAVGGTGTPNTDLQLSLDGDVVGTAQVDADGNWDSTITLPEPGSYTLIAEALNSRGTVAAASSTLTIIRPEPAAIAPTIFYPADEGDVFIGDLIVIGNGEPGVEVELFNDAESLGTTTVEPGGEWRIRIPVDAGTYLFNARNVADPTASSNTIQTRVISPTDPHDCESNAGIDRGDGTYIVGSCDSLATIIEDFDLDFETLIAINGQIENIDLIYPGETINLP